MRLASRTSANTSAGQVEKQVKRQQRLNKDSHSDSGSGSASTIRGPPKLGPYKISAKRRLNPISNEQKTASERSKIDRRAHTANPLRLTVSDLVDLQETIQSAVTPTWMTRPPKNVGMKSAGTPKASEWFSLYTVYMVLSTIPDMYHSEDPNRQAICESIIQACEITNITASRRFSHDDGDQLASTLKNYRTHLQLRWLDISVKRNLHFAQHIPKITRLFGPPSYTAGWVGERMNGVLIKVPKNYHLG